MKYRDYIVKIRVNAIEIPCKKVEWCYGKYDNNKRM